ncbi:L-threonylcarbamoyladenylate synthase [Gilvibacter sp.]|uniref:L-threonylcarbamoyladenylate synthase n=1 Tax=Gilvibacter sp. TaxID=2729997 RepID=UPI003F4A5BAD
MRAEVDKTFEIVKKGGTIAYPTDTVWGLGCDSTNYDSVERLFEIKQRPAEKSMICLVDSLRMLDEFFEKVPETAFQILKYADKPTTLILDNAIRVSENVIAKDGSLGVRVVNDNFCKALIRKLKRPLVSTSANISGEPTAKTFSEINPLILEGVDYVVNLHRDRKAAKPSSIIKLSVDGAVKVIRQ